MAVTISGGWLSGSLPDDTGKQWPIVQHRQAPTGPQKINPPNLVLHTTETDSYVKSLQFPSNFQCGEGQIGQHIQLQFSGDAVLVHDNENIGIEMVGRSKLNLWLPGEPTLGPVVALVAWLHQTNRIKTGIKRPTAKWPDVLDRGPEAVLGYYRRHAGLWPNVPGVYGHVDLPDNEHWDPGSFNYPAFFKRVETALSGKPPGDDMSEYADGQLDYLDHPTRPLPLPDAWSVDKKNGYKVAKALASSPKAVPGPPGPVDPNSHTHKPGIVVAGAPE